MISHLGLKNKSTSTILPSNMTGQVDLTTPVQNRIKSLLSISFTSILSILLVLQAYVSFPLLPFFFFLTPHQHWDSSPSSSLSVNFPTVPPSFPVDNQVYQQDTMCINLDQLVGVVVPEATFADSSGGPFKSTPPEAPNEDNTLDDEDEDKDEDEDADAEGEDEDEGEDVDFNLDPKDSGEKWSSVSTPSNISEYRPSASPRAEDVHDKPPSSPSGGRYHPYATLNKTAFSSKLKASSPETHATRKRSESYTSRSTASSIGIPIPIPNLTKKSRGRKVPTTTTLFQPPDPSDDEYPSNGRRGRSNRGGGNRARKSGPSSSSSGRRDQSRTYRCQVVDCGKCFVRGEHLKRHIRSIHTNEKREHPPPSLSSHLPFHHRHHHQRTRVLTKAAIERSAGAIT